MCGQYHLGVRLRYDRTRLKFALIPVIRCGSRGEQVLDVSLPLGPAHREVARALPVVRLERESPLLLHLSFCLLDLGAAMNTTKKDDCSSIRTLKWLFFENFSQYET